MKRLFLLLHFTFCILPSAFCISNDGYPLANFGLTVNASADGSMFGEVLQNTGALGEWLTEKGSVQFYVEKRGKSHDFAGFK